jgi:hypothetical protein
MRKNGRDCDEDPGGHVHYGLAIILVRPRMEKRPRRQQERWPKQKRATPRRGN